MSARRMHWHVVFGDGSERWQFPDPCSDAVNEANHAARYGTDEQKIKAALLLADVVSALGYLVNVCPTTKLACEKLAAVRRAVRELPEAPPSGPTTGEEGR